MLNSFQPSVFIRRLLLNLDLPDNASKQEIDKLPHDEYIAIYMVVSTWERLGILIFRREIDLKLFDDAYSELVIQSWQKLEEYIRDYRMRLGRDTVFEWFQWLAERMMDRETSEKPTPAYEAYRDWKSTL